MSDTAKILGKALIYASIQVALANMELYPKLLYTFIEKQPQLKIACKSLRNFLYLSIIWLTGTSLIMYSEYGIRGALYTLLANITIIGWIYYSYYSTITQMAKNLGLKVNIWNC